MQGKQPASESRRKFLRKLALSPVLANPRLIALGNNEFFPQLVKSLRSVEAHVRPTIQQLSQEIRKKSISPVEVTRDCLAHIEELDPKLNAFITVLADSALDQAHRAEREIHSGNYRGPLHGIPIGLKDLIDTAGTRTTASSAQFKHRIPEAHVGPLTNSVEDAAFLLQILAGYDPGDPSSIDVPVGDFASHLDRFPSKLRIGVPRAFFFEKLHPDVAQAAERAIQVLAGLHAEIREVKLDVPADRTVLTSEAWAYHE